MDMPEEYRGKKTVIVYTSPYNESRLPLVMDIEADSTIGWEDFVQGKGGKIFGKFETLIKIFMS